jgi:hypothetical protein
MAFWLPVASSGRGINDKQRFENIVTYSFIIRVLWAQPDKGYNIWTSLTALKFRMKNFEDL